jgi:hypothetical protein
LQSDQTNIGLVNITGGFPPGFMPINHMEIVEELEGQIRKCGGGWEEGCVGTAKTSNQHRDRPRPCPSTGGIPMNWGELPMAHPSNGRVGRPRTQAGVPVPLPA